MRIVTSISNVQNLVKELLIVFYRLTVPTYSSLFTPLQSVQIF